jgi:molybdenum cofactor synthesis domain-containing protein
MDVAIVTVGDELLSGDTTNTNATWLCEQLTERGVDVRRVSVLPDDVSVIARVVNEFRAEYDAVVVTGGLGPTHDDLTMEAVAAACGQALEANEEAVAWLETHGGYSRDDLTEGTEQLPAGARVLHNEVGVAPGCVVDSIYVLPGVPAEMKQMFGTVAEEFVGPERHVEVVIADEPESALLDRLDQLREQFPAVTVGSYPGAHVRVKFSGTDESAVAAAAEWLGERVTQPDD